MNDQQSDRQIEAAAEAKGLNAPKVTTDQIDALMARVTYVAVHRPGGTTSTYVHAYLDGQFALATGFSACVDPANYDAAIGEEIATKKAKALARDKLWELEGYRLFQYLKDAS